VNWEAVGAIGEIGGAFGVIVTLLYLATQVRRSTREARHAAARSVQDKFSATLRSISASAPLADAYARSVKGWDHLESEGEMMQISALWLDLLRSYEELITYRDQGLIDDAPWTSVDSLMRSVMSSKGFSDWWSIRGSWFSPEFQRRVEATRPEIGRDLLEDHRSAATRDRESEGRASQDQL